MDSAVSLALSDNHGLTDECQKLTNKIRGALFDIAHSFVYIGFLLAECDYYETYKEWGYSSIHEYALDQFGFKKSSTYNFINICKVFSDNEQNAKNLNFPYAMTIKGDYREFNYSQLVEMLSMNEKQRSQVTPDMSVKQIREVKKSSDESDSRRLESVPEEASAPDVPEEVSASDVPEEVSAPDVPEELEPEVFSYPGYDLIIPLRSDLHALFDSIEEAYLDVDKNIDSDLFDMVFGYLKSNDYIICKKVNKKPKNRFALK